ncbi:MAG: glycoside hydrolase TIM-barrel-like domain-containing protein [bacterium]
MNIKGVTFAAEHYLNYTFKKRPEEGYTGILSTKSLSNARSIGINYITILASRFMDNGYSSFLSQDPQKTPTDEEILHLITKTKGMGLKILIKPHVDCRDVTWRGIIRPKDLNFWFKSYDSFMQHYARIAQETGADMFCMGCELISLSLPKENLPYWKKIIANVRKIYKGPITYAANWNTYWEYKNVPFWDLLDYAGIDAYFPVSNSPKPSVGELKKGWEHYKGECPDIPDGPHRWLDEMEEWHKKIKKPIIITELGYRSIEYPGKAPYAWAGGVGENNASSQANCYEATLSIFKDKKWCEGIFWWNWLTNPEAGGTGDNDYTPQNKPTEKVLKKYYLK